MTERVPLTLFTTVNNITVHATWSDPLNTSDPWNGYPYQWDIQVEVRSQTHSDAATPRPFTYNGLDVNIGDWIIFGNSTIALEIISISSQTDTTINMIVEDVNLNNILNDSSQTGHGIGSVSPPGSYDCLLINLNSSGIPIFASMPDYSVSINLISDITNRFQFQNYIQDYILGTQPSNSFSIGDVIYLDTSGNYHKSEAGISGSNTSIGTITSVNQPSVGDFTYRPIGRYVTNLPTLPGLPGELLYVSDNVPGGLTSSIPSEGAIPVYIKISNTSAILSPGNGGIASLGNISIIGNTISSTNIDGNVNIYPNGNGNVNVSNFTALTGSFSNLTSGRVVIVGPNGQLVDTNYFLFDMNSEALSIGNLKLSSEYITTTTSGVPLILSANSANVQVVTTLDITGNKIINLEDPTEPQDAATKSYVDAVASGLNAKIAVLLATTIDLDATFTPDVGYGSLTGNYEVLEIDGMFPTVYNRILVKDQIDETQNGIYDVMQSGNISQPWLLTRSLDFNGQGNEGEINGGDFVFVQSGDTLGGTGWVLTTTGVITINVSNIIWTQFSSAGVIHAGFGLEQTGTVFDVNVVAIISNSTGLTSTVGSDGFQIIEMYLDNNAPLEFYNGALRVKNTIAGIGLSYSLTSGNLSINNIQPTITGVGNITSGTWSSNVITYNVGGTGLSILGNPGQVLSTNNLGTAIGWSNKSQITESDTTPFSPTPVDGDRWFNTDSGILFTYITDNTGNHWVEL